MTSITFHEHRVYFGGSRENHTTIASALTPFIAELVANAGYEKVDLYNLGGQPHAFKTGTKHRLLVFVNTTANNEADMSLPFYEPIKEEGNILFEEDGKILAEYQMAEGQLNILFDLFPSTAEENVDMFKKIMAWFDAEVLEAIKNRTSWVKTQSKDSLVTDIKKAYRDSKESELNDLKYKLRDAEQNAKSYQTELKKSYDRIFNARNNIENIESNLETIHESFIKQLDAIAAHKKVVDLRIEGNDFEVYTTDIICQHDRTDDLYYIGKFKIVINMNNSRIRFWNLNNPRHGYWGSKTQAPHVSEDGEPCLGNVAGTIAELSSQMEILALAMVCIDFLENVNTSDPAGRKITKWDKCDEKGNILEKAEDVIPEGCFRCPMTNEIHNEEYAVAYYPSATQDSDGDWDFDGERMDVYEDWAQENCTWLDNDEVYVGEALYHHEEDSGDEDEEEVTTLDEVFEQILTHQTPAPVQTFELWDSYNADTNTPEGNLVIVEREEAETHYFFDTYRVARTLVGGGVTA